VVGEGIKPKWLDEKLGQGQQLSEFVIHYQNPDNPNEKWSGDEKSTPPKWLSDKLAQGYRAEELMIPTGVQSRPRCEPNRSHP
jgi:hypothetical protein